MYAPLRAISTLFKIRNFKSSNFVNFDISHLTPPPSPSLFLFFKKNEVPLMQTLACLFAYASSVGRLFGPGNVLILYLGGTLSDGLARLLFHSRCTYVFSPPSPPSHPSFYSLTSTTSIPGPIEVTDEVLYANAHPSMSHISPEFVPVFGDCIRMVREVLLTKDAQPFLISGSGTLGWDQVSLCCWVGVVSWDWC